MPNHELYRASKREGIRGTDLAADPDLAARLLDGRMAKCSSCSREPVPSGLHLSLFEYQGPGSYFAENHCGHQRPKSADDLRRYPTPAMWTCGYAPCAHLPINPLTDIPTTLDHDFVPRTAGNEFDTWYCGCRGWD